MHADSPESDWKLFRKYKDAMLEALTGRINGKSKEILDSANLTQHERYLTLYDHIQTSNRIIGDCFNVTGGVPPSGSSQRNWRDKS